MIKFPKVHIAESVVSRILNVRDELRADNRVPPVAEGAAGVEDALGEASRAPAVPEAGAQGRGIEEAMTGESALSGMVPELGEPDAAAAAGSILEGGTALEGLLKRRTEQ